MYSEISSSKNLFHFASQRSLKKENCLAPDPMWRPVFSYNHYKSSLQHAANLLRITEYYTLLKTNKHSVGDDTVSDYQSILIS